MPVPQSVTASGDTVTTSKWGLQSGTLLVSWEDKQPTVVQTQRNDRVMSQQEGAPMKAKERGLTRTHSYPYLDLELPHSRTVRKQISIALTTQFVALCDSSPSKLRHSVSWCCRLEYSPPGLPLRAQLAFAPPPWESPGYSRMPPSTSSAQCLARLQSLTNGFIGRPAMSWSPL